jgi:uncharacterized protein
VQNRRALSFWQVLVLIVVTLVLAGLLGAKPLHAAAKNIDSGPLRALALVVTTPLDAVSGWLRLDKPHEWVRGETEEDVAGTDTTETTDGQGDGSTSTTDTATTTVTSATVTTEGPTTTVPKPVFTDADPLRVFLAGDSLMIEVGHAFTRESEGLGSLELYRINKVSSGFATPEFYDWPAHLSDTVAEFDPQVTVMMFGGNEKVPMTVDGAKVQPFTEEWNAEYVRRVKEGIKIVTDSGCVVIWIGMPIMLSSKFSETARTLNAMYEQICLDDPNAYYIDAYALFSDSNGEYSAYLPDSNGDTQLVREEDGIHFTPAGGDRVVKAVLERLYAAYDLQ